MSVTDNLSHRWRESRHCGARKLTRALGHRITYVDAPDDAVRQGRAPRTLDELLAEPPAAATA